MSDFARFTSAQDAQNERVAHLRLHSDDYYADKLGKTSKRQLPYQERFKEELRAVQAQLAVQLCLDLPPWQPTTMQQARKVGNAGGGHSAFMPREENLSKNYHLIVDPAELDEIIHWLVVPADGGFWLKGWITAGEAKTYPLKAWNRPDSGGWSESHWVPRGALYYFAERP